MNEPTQSESSLSTGRDLVEEDSSRGRSIEPDNTSPVARKRPRARSRGFNSESAHSRADSEIVRRLLEGDEVAFDELVESYNSTMIRVARAHVPSRAVAEEVAQEAWLALLQGLSGFKGKSSLKTWLFGILLNRAKTRGKKEKRSVNMSSLSGDSAVACIGVLETFPLFQHSNRSMSGSPFGPTSWVGSPEHGVLNGEIGLCIEKTIEKLPSCQRTVLILRDIEGWSSGEVCDLLEISPENQRVRLHRARSKIRDAIRARFLRGNKG